MNTLSTLFELAPSILKAITGVEGVLNTTNTKETKKAIVLGVIDAVAKAGEGVPNTLVQAISTFVDNTVTALNAPVTK